MTELEALLKGIVADPTEETRWLVLADWLEENDDVRRAELLRLHRKLLATCCEPDKITKAGGTFGPEEITSGYGEFLGYFMPTKVRHDAGSRHGHEEAGEVVVRERLQ